MVDNTFATPMLVRPFDLAPTLSSTAQPSISPATATSWAGIVVSDEAHHATVRSLARIAGPSLGPFESYLTMRGMKTLALRFERQCQNAKALAGWLAQHTRRGARLLLRDPNHPDADVIRNSFAPGLFGAILSFEIRGADKSGSSELYGRASDDRSRHLAGGCSYLAAVPAIASHRNLSPKMRERMGIRENLVRVAAGIEHIDDIKADLDQALAATA